jgi:hypothetical protein
MMVSNSYYGEFRSQDWKTRVLLAIITYNFSVAGQTETNGVLAITFQEFINCSNARCG